MSKETYISPKETCMPHEERYKRDLKRSYQRDLKRSYQRDLYTLDLHELAVKFIHIEICETYHKRNPQNIPICPNTDSCASTRFCTSLFIFSNVYVSFQLFNFSNVYVFLDIRVL